MRKIKVITLLVSVFVVLSGCAGTPVSPTTEPTATVEPAATAGTAVPTATAEIAVPITTVGTSIEILTNPNLQFIWNVPYRDPPEYSLKLEASVPSCRWEVVSGSPPTGLTLGVDGRITGIASVLDETGTFTAKVTKGRQVGTRVFVYKVIDVVWVTPGTVNIGNFSPGSRAEYAFRVHNDYSVMNEQKTVITDSTDIPDSQGFISVPIPVSQKLHNGELDSVLSVVSSEPADKLSSVSYDPEKNMVIVSGFLPLTKRIISISYAADSLFGVTYKVLVPNGERYTELMSKVKEGTISALEQSELDATKAWVGMVTEMIQVKETQFVLRPHETKSVEVAFEMPESFVPGVKQFKFQTSSGRAARIASGAQLNVATAVTWIVTMK